MKIVRDGDESLVNILNFDRRGTGARCISGIHVRLPRQGYRSSPECGSTTTTCSERSFTPRLHTRFNLSEHFRAQALSRKRNAGCQTCSSKTPGVLASSRQLVFSGFQSGKAYGYQTRPARGITVLNFSQDFTLDYRPGTITVQIIFIRTFQNQVVVDMDKSVREVNFFGLSGKSYSHSYQFQVDYQLMRRFDLRMAYRLVEREDRLQQWTCWIVRSFQRSPGICINLAYETKNKWKFDYTVQWLGEQRIPDTSENPEAHRLAPYSPDYVLMNAQVSKDLKDQWSVYLGHGEYDGLYVAGSDHGRFRAFWSALRFLHGVGTDLRKSGLCGIPVSPAVVSGPTALKSKTSDDLITGGLVYCCIHYLLDNLILLTGLNCSLEIPKIAWK
jgi:hypothetical protein